MPVHIVKQYRRYIQFHQITNQDRSIHCWHCPKLCSFGDASRPRAASIRLRVCHIVNAASGFRVNPERATRLSITSGECFRRLYPTSTGVISQVRHTWNPPASSAAASRWSLSITAIYSADCWCCGTRCGGRASLVYPWTRWELESLLYRFEMTARHYKN